MGSGVPLAIGRLALWLIEGYGKGRLVIYRPDERDHFVLDTRSLKGLLAGAACSESDLRASCIAIGRRLRH